MSKTVAFAGLGQRRRAAQARTLGRICVGICTCAAVVAAGWLGVREYSDPRFFADAVSVAGNERLAKTDIIAAAAIARDRNVWFVDVRKAARRIERLPWIESAAISRRWPNHVRITVSERMPAFRLRLPRAAGAAQTPQRYALLDKTLRVLSVGSLAPADLSLPLLSLTPTPKVLTRPGAWATSTDVAPLYGAMLRLRSLGVNAAVFDLTPETGISALVDGRWRVLFGKLDDLEEKVALLRAIVPKIDRPKDVVNIDLRAVRAPAVLYR